MTRTSLFILAGCPMGSATSGSSYRNDDNRYVDEKLVDNLVEERNSVMQLMSKAEEKQFTEPDIKKWLVSIKHTMYDANALLDEIDTEKQFREKYKEDGSASYSISGFVQRATSEIKRIIEGLEGMVKKATNMGLKARDEGAAASAWQTQVRNDRITSPVLSKSTIVYGREDEKAQILEKVLYSPEPSAPGIKPEVIAIVGMGGLGKTTLAQYVYNHADVERCFTRSWACVSDNLDLVRVTGAILESLTESAVGVCGLASLQRQLEKQLTGKRFLVVLDDAWDSSNKNWEKLMAPFSTGVAGSKIILTTRDMRVARVVPADHSFQLKSMSEHEAWSLFSHEVFRDGKLSQHPKLEAIGKEIVKKCGGSPLAIKTLSGILRSERNEVEWERVRESSLWQLPEGQKDVIPALGLSYSYLPSHLKTCFAYCSLFPKDYRFSKKELVNLWVDEGFLQQPNDNRSIEDVGVASFDDLSSRSFFTHVYKELYVMHDLIHDFAQMVFADFHLQLNGHKAVKECKKVRHVSFHDTSECGSSSKFEGLNQAESLQTFLVQYKPPAPKWGLDVRILEDVLRQQLSLRVLCLQGARIRTLPDTISNLKQLRHLDVSYSDVEELPASLCELYNLRSLLCESCDQIKEFYYDMAAAFVSLRHFTLSGRQLQKAPWNLSQLSRVKLESSDVIVIIDRSTFLFEFYGEDALIATDLLESLRPHRDVKEVCIEEFNGTEFPGWLGDRSYHSIEKVVLYNCRISSGLMPALGGLPSLKHLRLKGVRNVKKLGSTVPFGSLEELYFEHMNEWEEWEPSDDDATGGGICFFPHLRKLSIFYCHELKGRLPSDLPSLKELEIEFCSSLVELNGCHRHRQVVDLRIYRCGTYLANSCLVDVSDGMFPHLQRLAIGPCDSYESLCLVDVSTCVFTFSLPTTLTYLQIWGFTWLRKLDVFRLRSLTNLEELEIHDCPLLESLGWPLVESLGQSSDVDDCSSDDEFPFNSYLRRLAVWRSINSSLRVLKITHCEELKTINGPWVRSLTNLEELEICNCSEFLALPDEGLPRSLTKLCLEDFKNIRVQDWIVIQNLTSLEILKIKRCNELKALPVKLPCSLKKLILEGNHRDLEERCKRDTGPDWPNIAHVPDIMILQ